jgi:hypothetical protein
MNELKRCVSTIFSAPWSGFIFAMLLLNSAVAAPTRVTFGNVPQPVTQSNTPSTPLFVTSSDDRNGVGAQCDASVDTTGNAHCTLALIPAGKTLVITTVSCAATVPNGHPFVGLQMSMNGVPVGGGAPTTINHFLHLTLAETDPIAQHYRLTTPLKIYASGGTNGTGAALAVHGNLGMPTNLNPSMACAVSGFMVDQ